VRYLSLKTLILNRMKSIDLHTQSLPLWMSSLLLFIGCCIPNICVLKLGDIISSMGPGPSNILPLIPAKGYWNLGEFMRELHE
jgi:hypothetical protein